MDQGEHLTVIRYIALRLALLVPTLLGVLVITFALLSLAKGDPVLAILGERADSAAVARVRTELHLDDPIYLRFAKYVGDVATGDLGRSYVTHRPIAHELMQRFPATLKLASAAMAIAIMAGLAIGIQGAVRPGSWPDTSPRLAPTSASRFRSTGSASS